MNQSLWIRFIHPRGIARSERLDGGKGPDVLVPVVFDEKGWTRMKRWGNLFNFNMVGCSAEKGPMACGCLWLKWLYINPRWNLGGEGYFPWCRYLLAGYNPQQYRKQNPLKKKSLQKPICLRYKKVRHRPNGFKNHQKKDLRIQKCFL